MSSEVNDEIKLSNSNCFRFDQTKTNTWLHNILDNSYTCVQKNLMLDKAANWPVGLILIPPCANSKAGSVVTRDTLDWNRL